MRIAVAGLFILGVFFIVFLSIRLYRLWRSIFGKSKSKTSKNGYAKIAPGQVVWRSTLLGFIAFREYPIPEADYNSFVIIHKKFAKDRRYAYYRHLYFAVDLPSFEVVSDYYSKDKDSIFFKNTRLLYSNPVTMVEIEPFMVADDQNVYYQSTLISHHAGQFTKISEQPVVYKAPDVVFFDYQIMEQADPATFELVDGSLSKKFFRDKNGIYFLNVKMKQADLKSFTPLNNDYARDKNHLFFQEKILTGADYGSFIVIEDGNAKDKNHRFVEGKAVK